MNRERVIPLTIHSSQLIQTAPMGPTASRAEAPANAHNFPHLKKSPARHDAAVTVEAPDFSPMELLFIALRRGQRRPNSAPSNTAAFLRAIGEPATS